MDQTSSDQIINKTWPNLNQSDAAVSITEAQKTGYIYVRYICTHLVHMYTRYHTAVQAAVDRCKRKHDFAFEPNQAEKRNEGQHKTHHSSQIKSNEVIGHMKSQTAKGNP